MNPKVDEFLKDAQQWQDEFTHLRAIVLDCGLAEVLKWRLPCYTLNKNNIVIIQGFKEYCALMFFKGALLKDSHQVLVKIGNAQAGRQVRFTHVGEIIESEPILKEYINEAIEVEKAGMQVKYKTTDEFTVPEEFQSKLDEIPGLKTAFAALTPGRQRAYLHHFSQPKQSKTRGSRVEKCIPLILEGKGLND